LYRSKISSSSTWVTPAMMSEWRGGPKSKSKRPFRGAATICWSSHPTRARPTAIVARLYAPSCKAPGLTQAFCVPKARLSLTDNFPSGSTLYQPSMVTKCTVVQSVCPSCVRCPLPLPVQEALFQSSMRVLSIQDGVGSDTSLCQPTL
jgi:hypothetical protein